MHLCVCVHVCALVCVCVCLCVCVCVCVCVYYTSKVLWDPNLDADYYTIYPTSYDMYPPPHMTYILLRIGPVGSEPGRGLLQDIPHSSDAVHQDPGVVPRGEIRAVC